VKKLFVLSIIILPLIACTNSPHKLNDDVATVDTFIIPPNAIPIIPYEYMVVQGNVDSVQGSFLIDTGVGEFCLDSIFQYSNHFKKYNYHNSSISGVGNSSQKITEVNDSVSLSIGHITYRTSHISVINMKPIGGDLLDGLVGTDFFAKRVLEINYAKGYIQIYKDIDSVNISGYTVIAMKHNYWYCVPLTIKINNSVTIKGDFILDTGSPASTLSSSVAQKNNLDKKIKRKVRYYTAYGGVGGESSGYDFMADSLQISDYCLKNAILSFSADTSGLLADDKYMGIIGNDILGHFNIIFDFKNNNLYLKPNENYNSPFIHDKLGFLYVNRCKTMGGWLVTGLYENTAAEKQGLRIDDIIISVNGIPTEKISYTYQKNTLTKLDNVKLVIKRAGSIKNIDLKLSSLL
jgi:hypothetical protein